MSKTITAVFGNGIFTTTAKVFQWDAGDKLQFVGIDLPENYKVEFANSLTGVAKPGEIPVWRQPTGAQDAYNTGDKVHYPDADGPVYVSTLDGNVLAPGVYGWELA